MSDSLYAEEILDHYRHPRNKGPLANAFTAGDSNPTCGDELSFHLKLTEGKISKATFEGTGCAISQASASMLTEKLVGMTTRQVLSLSRADIYAMLGVPISPARNKCAMLSLKVAKMACVKALGGEKEPGWE